MNQKGFASLVIIAAIALVVVAGGFGFVIYQDIRETNEIEERTKLLSENENSKSASETDSEVTVETQGESKSSSGSTPVRESIDCGTTSGPQGHVPLSLGTCMDNNVPSCHPAHATLINEISSEEKPVTLMEILGPANDKECSVRHTLVSGYGDPSLNGKYTTCRVDRRDTVFGGSIELLDPEKCSGTLIELIYGELEKELADSNDAKRIMHLSQFKVALESYYADHNSYPSMLSVLVPMYIPIVAQDPKGTDYFYRTCNANANYVVSATLEDSNNKELETDVDASICPAVSCTDPYYCVQK